MAGKKKKKRGLGLHHILLFVVFLVFIYTGLSLLQYMQEGAAEESAFSELSAMVEHAMDTSKDNPPVTMTVTDESGEETVIEVPIRYTLLNTENTDYVGWLNVPNTNIDYPVMITPDDPQFYLHRAFDKTNSKAGTLFFGEYCNENTLVSIIYGHNMKNDSMFGTLDNYLKADFCAENPYFTFESNQGLRTYQVFAAAKTRILPTNTTELVYYQYVGDLMEEDYQLLVNWIDANKLYDTGVIPQYGDQILMLSTCSYHTNDGRFFIAAKRVE